MDPLAPTLRLQLNQRIPTPGQEAEARCFAEAFIQQQLSMEPVDEADGACS